MQKRMGGRLGMLALAIAMVLAGCDAVTVAGPEPLGPGAVSAAKKVKEKPAPEDSSGDLDTKSDFGLAWPL